MIKLLYVGLISADFIKIRFSLPGIKDGNIISISLCSLVKARLLSDVIIQKF